MPEPLRLVLCTKAPPKKRIIEKMHGHVTGISPEAWLSVTIVIGMFNEYSAHVTQWICRSCQIRVWADNGKVFLRLMPKTIRPGIRANQRYEYEISKTPTIPEAKRVVDTIIAALSVKRPQYD